MYLISVVWAQPTDAVASCFQRTGTTNWSNAEARMQLHICKQVQVDGALAHIGRKPFSAE
jgi:hypothetical protein